MSKEILFAKNNLKKISHDPLEGLNNNKRQKKNGVLEEPKDVCDDVDKYIKKRSSRKPR